MPALRSSHKRHERAERQPGATECEAIYTRFSLPMIYACCGVSRGHNGARRRNFAALWI